MKIQWLVEEKITVRGEGGRYRIRIKKHILEKLSGTRWNLDDGRSISFKNGKAYFYDHTKQQEEEEMDVFCGPRGNFELAVRNHILIINFLQNYTTKDSELENKSLSVLASPSFKGNTFKEKVEEIRDTLREADKKDYDLLEFIYLSKDAKDKLFEIGNKASGSMEAQFINPLNALREDKKEYEAGKNYIKTAIDKGDIVLELGLQEGELDGGK